MPHKALIFADRRAEPTVPGWVASVVEPLGNSALRCDRVCAHRFVQVPESEIAREACSGPECRTVR